MLHNCTLCYGNLSYYYLVCPQEFNLLVDEVWMTRVCAIKRRRVLYCVIGQLHLVGNRFSQSGKMSISYAPKPDGRLYLPALF